MNTNKHIQTTFTIWCIALAILASEVLLLVGYHNLVVYEYEVRLEQQRRDAEEIELKLKATEQALEKFTNPIEYSRAAAPTYDIPLSVELQQYTYDTCVVYGIEEHYTLILGMMWRESRFDAAAVSSTNDYGILQINKCNHEYLKETLGIVDIMDPQDNIESGVYIMSTLIAKYGDEHKALMAYNMGPTGATVQWSRGNYTSAYSRDVLAKAELIESNKYSEDI